MCVWVRVRRFIFVLGGLSGRVLSELPSDDFDLFCDGAVGQGVYG